MDSTKVAFLKLKLVEVELISFEFSKCFKKNYDEVLKFAIDNYIKEYNISLDNICLSSNEIKKMTIPKLKDELKLRNLPISGKKDELITRLGAHYEKIKSYSTNT